MTGIVRRQKPAPTPPVPAKGQPGQNGPGDGGGGGAAVGPYQPPPQQPKPDPELTVDGKPVDYVPLEYDVEQSWNLVPAATRQWATVRAGEPINDPVTRRVHQYRWCMVTSMSGAGSPAEYELTLFGKRGLVVARGATDELVPEPGRTRWRTARWDVPLDPGSIRHDHHTAAMGHTPGAISPSDPAPARRPDATSGNGFGEAGGRGADDANPDDLVTALLGDGTLAGWFGNLPAVTQRFLLQPFVRSGTEPQDVGVNPHHTVMGHEETEEFWAHLFNKRWVAFCYARRTAPRRGRKASAKLDAAPWAVAAWVAPALPPNQAALPAP